MISLNRRTKIFVCREPTDMRASYDTLLSLIRSLWRYPGRIREDGRLVEVELESIDLKPMRQTLHKVLEDLSQNNQLRMSDGRLLRIKMMRPG